MNKLNDSEEKYIVFYQKYMTSKGQPRARFPISDN